MCKALGLIQNTIHMCTHTYTQYRMNSRVVYEKIDFIETECKMVFGRGWGEWRGTGQGQGNVGSLDTCSWIRARISAVLLHSRVIYEQ